MRRGIFLVVWALIIFLLLVGCTKKVETQAMSLLKRYNLTLSNQEPNIRKTKLSKYSIQEFNTASKEIGLDLANYQNEEVDVLSYPLKNQAQGETGKISANFLFKDNKIIGAFLTLHDYIPGVSSFMDRSNFMPKKLNANDLTFENVEYIEIFGSSKTEIWGKRAIIKNSNQFKELNSILRKNIRKKGNVLYVKGDETYMLVFHYKDGPLVRYRLFTKSQTSETFLTADPYLKFHYIPPAELKSYILRNLND